MRKGKTLSNRKLGRHTWIVFFSYVSEEMQRTSSHKMTLYTLTCKKEVN